MVLFCRVDSSEPPGGAGLLLYDDAGEVFDCFFEAFVGGHVGIFVFDGEDVVVVVATEHGDEWFPEFVAVAVAAGSEDP